MAMDNKRLFLDSFGLVLGQLAGAEKIISTSESRPALEGVLSKSGIALERMISKSGIALDEAYSSELAGVDAAEYSVQKPIRNWFGKDGVNKGKIGAHPDFEYLDGKEETKYHYITTLFIDIQNSTRLSFFYEIEVVRFIKNAILRAASETVRALDGHVHRFMGDALMAYFGGPGQDRESTTLAALNCAVMLRLLMKETIIPALEERGCTSSDIGFRVGIDYGNDEQVLWSSYGYGDVSEVTATSFYVDAAAKLQSMATKDGVMIGGNLVQFLDVAEFLISQKIDKKDGIEVPILYLLPNYEIANGEKRDYRIYELNCLNLTRILPIPLEMREGLVPNSGLKHCRGIEFKAYIKGDVDAKEYRSISTCLNKEDEIIFRLTIDSLVFSSFRKPLRGEWVRKNYGQEAIDKKMDADEKFDFEIIPSTAVRSRKPSVLKQERVAEYRGIHTVEIKIFDAKNELIFADILGVHVR